MVNARIQEIMKNKGNAASLLNKSISYSNNYLATNSTSINDRKLHSNEWEHLKKSFLFYSNCVIV